MEGGLSGDCAGDTCGTNLARSNCWLMAALMALTICAGGGADVDKRIRESAAHARSSNEPLVP
jgi:hypothetical protein